MVAAVKKEPGRHEKSPTVNQVNSVNPVSNNPRLSPCSRPASPLELPKKHNPMGDHAVNEPANEKPVPAPEAEVIKPESGRVEVSADLLNEAVTQLRKLTEIRQREAERQERAIAQMHKAIKRQGVLSRYVILTSTLAIVLVIGLAYLIHDAGQKADVTATSLFMVEKSVSDANRTIATETKRQAESLDSVRAEVSASRETAAGLLNKVEEQLSAVREERDQVRGEVRNVLEEKTREIADKELALAAEREAIVEAGKRSKEEQKALIQQTIERLNAMSASLSEEETEPARAEETPAEITETEAATAVPTEFGAQEAVSEAGEIVESVETESAISEEQITAAGPESEIAAPATEEQPKTRKKR